MTTTQTLPVIKKRHPFRWALLIIVLLGVTGFSGYKWYKAANENDVLRAQLGTAQTANNQLQNGQRKSDQATQDELQHLRQQADQDASRKQQADNAAHDHEAQLKSLLAQTVDQPGMSDADRQVLRLKLAQLIMTSDGPVVTDLSGEFTSDGKPVPYAKPAQDGQRRQLVPDWVFGPFDSYEIHACVSDGAPALCASQLKK